MKNKIFFCLLISLMLFFFVSCATSDSKVHVQIDRNGKTYWDCKDMLRHLIVKRNMDDPVPYIPETDRIYSFFQREIYSQALENLKSRRGYIKMTLLSADVKPGNSKQNGTAELSFMMEIQDRSKITIWSKTYSGTKAFTDQRLGGTEDQVKDARADGIIALEAELLTQFWKDFVDSYPDLNKILPNLNDMEGFEKP